LEKEEEEEEEEEEVIVVVSHRNPPAITILSAAPNVSAETFRCLILPSRVVADGDALLLLLHAWGLIGSV